MNVAARDSFVVVAIAASAGGIPAIGEVLSFLPEHTPAAFLIVQHLAPTHISFLPEVLRRYTRMPIVSAREADTLHPGVILVAPPDRHMRVNPDGTVSLTEAAPIHHVRPSADVLFESVAEAFGPRAMALILSGTGEDGAHGAELIKSHGGMVLAQRDSGATFFSGMPSAAIRTGAVDSVLSAREMGAAIDAFAGGHSNVS